MVGLFVFKQLENFRRIEKVNKKTLPYQLRRMGDKIDHLNLELINHKFDDGLTGGFLEFAGNVQGLPCGMYDWQTEYNPKKNTTKLSYTFDFTYELTSAREVRVNVALMDLKNWLDELMKKGD